MTAHQLFATIFYDFATNFPPRSLVISTKPIKGGYEWVFQVAENALEESYCRFIYKITEIKMDFMPQSMFFNRNRDKDLNAF